MLVLGAVSDESGITDDLHQRLFDREVKFHALPCPRYQWLHRIPVRSALDRFLEFRDELEQGFVLVVDFLYTEGILVFPYHFSTSLVRCRSARIAATAIGINSELSKTKSSPGLSKLPMP
jgi:hypothetical protein